MKLPTLSLKQKTLSHFEEALDKEWLITNGLGGYASSTALGVNTRKYHGLLVAAMYPPSDRTVCIAKLDEEIDVDKSVYLLGANEFDGVVFPQGFTHLEKFSISPFPEYTYKVQNISIQKKIWLPHEKNALITIYNIVNGNSSDIKVKIFPLVNCRHFHSVTTNGRSTMPFDQSHSSRKVRISFSKPEVSLAVRTTAGEFREKPNWIERLLYRQEAARGESSIDDCYQPGYFEVRVPSESTTRFALTATASKSSSENAEFLDALGTDISNVDRLMETETQRLISLQERFYISTKTVRFRDWLNWIVLAANSFIVRTILGRESVIAGYHWFEPWGRDTFISLPGLLLVTSRFEDARNVLSNFGKLCRRGLIPNFVDDKSGEAAYNTVDASLWFVNAILQYLKYTGDFSFVQAELWETLQNILEYHVQGTDFDIRMDYDGLISHGPRLTWMDSEFEGVAATPRAGKAVEIQALWFNALKTAQILAREFSEKNLEETYGSLADRVKFSFNEKFWNCERNCLFDVVYDTGSDSSLRPNQIVACALDFSILDQANIEEVVHVIQNELLTPCGLRTLEPRDSKYKGVYIGDRRSRNEAYHNGSVWPWLFGPFVTSSLRMDGTQNSVSILKNMLESFFVRQISEAGLGTVNEIFDGDKPHIPRGCFAQAWSVAEPLRGYVEDVWKVEPKFKRELLRSKPSA